MKVAEIGFTGFLLLSLLIIKWWTPHIIVSFTICTASGSGGMEVNMDRTSTRAFGSPLKYIQGPGEFNNLETYTSTYGNKAFFLIDGFLYEDFNKRLQLIYSPSKSDYIAEKFGGECCQSEVDRLLLIVKKYGADIIVGMGGGKTCDTTKLIANEIEIPRILVPTSASTDAPTSGLAIIYTEKGEHRGAIKMKRNSEIVLMDTEIIVKAPIRLFIAGMGDALATYFEAKANDDSDSKNFIGIGYKRCKAGMAIAKMAYDILMEDGIKALLALERGVCTEAVENVIEANTLLSGLGFENTGCSAAHGIHSGLTELPCTHKYLHGEKVAFGIMCQMVIENTCTDEMKKVVQFMLDIGLPITLEQLDVKPIEENIRVIARKTVHGNSLIQSEPVLITEDVVYNAIIAADEIGKHLLKDRLKKCVI